MSYHPNSELVAVAWLGGVTGLTADMVGTDLPAADNTTIATSGYVQATAIGGSADMYTPQRNPNIQIDCWALASGSGRPPWNRAWHLANTIWAAVLDHPSVPREVDLPATYIGARVMSVWPTGNEPRPRPGDQGSYARIGFELTVAWVELDA